MKLFGRTAARWTWTGQSDQTIEHAVWCKLNAVKVGVLGNPLHLRDSTNVGDIWTENIHCVSFD